MLVPQRFADAANRRPPIADLRDHRSECLLRAQFAGLLSRYECQVSEIRKSHRQDNGQRSHSTYGRMLQRRISDANLCMSCRVITDRESSATRLLTDRAVEWRKNLRC
jgi:hypothetical protein